MKKLFKIMIALVLMLTFTFTITACNDDSAGADGTNSKELTVADIFNNIECSLGNGKLIKVSYEELSGSTTVDESKSSRMDVKAYASHKFEITKITAKYQSFYTNHTTSDEFALSVYDSTSFKNEIKDLTKSFTSKNDFNKQHTLTVEFASGELVIEKNKGVGILLSSHKSTGYANWTNIQIYGNVIEE